MRPRAAWIVAALLVLGFGVGFVASKQVGHDDAAPTPRSAPAAVTTPPPPTPVPTAVAPPPPKPVAAKPAFSVATLPQPVRSRLRRGDFWHAGCPVPLSGLRLLTVSYRGFDGRLHS